MTWRACQLAVRRSWASEASTCQARRPFACLWSVACCLGRLLVFTSQSMFWTVYKLAHFILPTLPFRPYRAQHTSHPTCTPDPPTPFPLPLPLPTPRALPACSPAGGQKARLALARTAYSQAEVQLLDDPLSAVDPRVGRVLFDQCISNTGLLAGACVRWWVVGLCRGSGYVRDPGLPHPNPPLPLCYVPTLPGLTFRICAPL